MATLKKAIIFEVPHFPNLQAKLNLIKKELENLGYRVFWQNPQPYKSAYLIKDAKVCFMLSEPFTANVDLIAKDYKAIGAIVEVIPSGKLDEITQKLKIKAEQKQKQNEKEHEELLEIKKPPEKPKPKTTAKKKGH